MPFATQEPKPDSALVVEKTVDSRTAGQKLLRFLVHEFRDSLKVRADIKRALRQKRVRVNGEITLDSHILADGDRVRVEVDLVGLIRSRLHGLDVDMKYSEPGLVVLIKARGVTKDEVEWAAAALRIVDEEYTGPVPTCDTVAPWFAAHDVEKGVRGLVVLVDSEEKQAAIAGHISMARGTLVFAHNPGLVLRRFMSELGYPVAGSQSHSKPLPTYKDRGSLQALIGVEFPSLAFGGKPVSVTEPVPPKLRVVCEREARFFSQRQEKARAEIEKLGVGCTEAGLLGAPEWDVELVNGKPAAYISGQKEFCGYAFNVTPDTLIPRPSTETLVDAAVGFMAQCNTIEPRIMDLGTGCGCILLAALLKARAASGVGVDISAAALEVARSNSQKHGLSQRAQFVEGTFQTLATDRAIVALGPFDFIACNPPYLSPTKASRMRVGTGHEPMLALVADDGGYQSYSDIHASLSTNTDVLKSGGWIGFEIGKGMEAGVRRIFSDWDEAAALRDSNGYLRVLVFQRP
ncbi:hypothetical protein GGF46_003913 [Coemansia sp. RSA 552]|nr:hypothetical protein GGF46_003913 [Coemansia sp. RSA 552]